MGIVRDLYMARKIGAGLKLPAPTLARLIKRMGYAPKHTPQTYGPAAIVEFTANMERKVKSLVVDISDANGLTGMTVHRVGRNFLENKVPSDSGYQSLTLTVDSDGVIDVDGTITGTTIVVANIGAGTRKTAEQQDGVKHLPNGSYTLSVGDDASTAGMALQVFGSNSISGSATSLASGNSVTINDTYKFNWVRIKANAGTYDHVKVYPMVKLSSDTSDTYEPYAGADHTVDWTDEAGSITSGTLDIISGELETGGNTYQLTPQEVKTLVGQNYVWSEAGDVTVTV